jgi:hypothetical protein
LWSSTLLVATPWERAFAELRSGDGPHGPLGALDANGIQLPAGFQSGIVAEDRGNMELVMITRGPFGRGARKRGWPKRQTGDVLDFAFSEMTSLRRD